MRTRLGRCGEWAQLFTTFARAAGFRARLVMDFTDHLWTEVSIPDKGWRMCDSCEGQYDVPLLYEGGWGKKLTYVFGLEPTYIVDVTRRYTARVSGEHMMDALCCGIIDTSS